MKMKRKSKMKMKFYSQKSRQIKIGETVQGSVYVLYSKGHRDEKKNAQPHPFK
jgi:hypothetical protein